MPWGSNFVLDKGEHLPTYSDKSDDDEYDRWQDNDELLVINRKISLFKYIIASSNGYNNCVIFRSEGLPRYSSGMHA